MPDILPMAVASPSGAQVFFLHSGGSASGAIARINQLFPELPPWTEPRNVRAGGSASTFQISAPTDGLEATLFRSRAELKVTTSRVAMHLLDEHRKRLFEAIDELLDKEHWEEESKLINIQSFRTFLRFLIYARPHKFPNLGVGQQGSLLAGWHQDGQSLHVEFFANDLCLALLNLSTPRGPEGLAWRGPVARLRAVIEHNDAFGCIE
jgi:hypothetical protein